MIENVYNISPQQINYILEVEATKSFNKASKLCFVTQPTLSMQIKKAEELLGFTIFDRSRSPIELTASGRQLLPLLKDIRNEYQRIWELKEKLEGNHVDHIRLGIIPTISCFLLVDIFESINKRMGHVQFEIIEMKSHQLLEALRDNKVDIGIMAGPHTEARMRTIPLFREEIYIYAPKLKGKVIHPDALENEQPWLLSKGNCLRTQMVHFCDLNEQSDVERQWNYEGGSIDLLTEMVDLNGGYTLIPANFKMDKKGLKRLQDTTSNQYPAREIIALFMDKSSKSDLIMELAHIIQLHYSKETKDDMRILSWR